MKKFLSNFFNGWNVTGSPQRKKNVNTLNLRTSRSSAPWIYGRIPCIMRSLHASLFLICRRPKIKYFASLCIRSYLKWCITTNWHKNCILPWTLREIARSLIIFFSLALQMPEISLLYDIHMLRTRDTPSHSGDRDARGTETQFSRSRPRKLPKNVKMLKTELGNCSPLFALHQLILHRQLLYSAGCRQREKNNVVFRKKKRFK